MPAETPYTPDDVAHLAGMLRVRLGWPISAGEAGTIAAAAYEALAETGGLLPPGARVCDALCRDVEADRDALRQQVERHVMRQPGDHQAASP